MFPMPSPAYGGTNLVGGHASQIRIARPALKDRGERIDIAGVIERRRGAKIHSETCLRRRSGQQNGSSGSEIREDLVPEAQAMIENRFILSGDAEVVTLCKFNHPVRRFGVVKDKRQCRRAARLKAGKSLRVRGGSYQL